MFLCQFTVSEREREREHSTMFDGVQDQFPQFMASRASLPLPLSFPLHGSSPTFPGFDPYTAHQPLQVQPLLLHQLQHQSVSPTSKDEKNHEENSMISTNLELERERLMLEPFDPWSNDEVLALLKIRSALENWFPDFTWEHVSRKLAELGFKRSAEKCKEKFAEESRHINSINFNKNYGLFSELEELYHGESPQISAEKNQNIDKPNVEEAKMGESLEEDSGNKTEANPSQENTNQAEKSRKSKKRRKEKFEMFKMFCEDIVNKMMVQQEELHNKLLEDMVKRDEEQIAREEAWKKQEMDWINKEIEERRHEQSIAGDRQATIIEFLNKFPSTSSQNQCFKRTFEDLLEVPNSSNSSTLPSLALAKNPSATSQLNTQNQHEETTSETMVLSHQNPVALPNQENPKVPISFSENPPPQNLCPTLAADIPKVPTSSNLAPSSRNPSSTNTQNNPLNPTPSSTHKSTQNPNYAADEGKDIGKRWPRDEVVALINLRCSIFSSGDDKEVAKCPLWERISQGMLQLGYKRSAKRCKEKWENINKYFRKTKDVNKKRSVDSRTCPYFHQLSTLYGQGTLMAPRDQPENCSISPKNHSSTPETPSGSSQVGFSDSNIHNGEGRKSEVQVPAFNFEF